MTDIFEGFRGGLSMLVVGPQGTGKSWLLGSAAKYGNPYLLAFRPKEVDSFYYQKYDVPYSLIHDRKWVPDLDSYVATGYKELLRKLWELQEDDEHDIILFDPLTDVNDLIKHEILSAYNADTPDDYAEKVATGSNPNKFKFWTELQEKWPIVMKNITALNFAPTPKHVLASVHARLPTEEDEKKEGMKYFGQVLPSLQGGYRLDIGGEFQIVLHTKIKVEYDQKERQQVESYVVEARANGERHNKIAIAPKLEERTLNNDFGEILEAIRGAMNDG